MGFSVKIAPLVLEWKAHLYLSIIAFHIEEGKRILLIYFQEEY